MINIVLRVVSLIEMCFLHERCSQVRMVTIGVNVDALIAAPEFEWCVRFVYIYMFAIVQLSVHFDLRWVILKRRFKH